MGKKKSKKHGYILVDRAKFIQARYDAYIVKKAAVRENGMERLVYMTDLDRTYEGQRKPQKDIVLCDRCNEDIEDPMFVMLADSLCYHHACVKDELPNNFMENVALVSFRKA